MIKSCVANTFAEVLERVFRGLAFNAERFAAVLLACSDYLADHAGLFSDAAECLRSFDWAALLAIESVDLQTAGTRPDQWLQAAADEARKMADPVSAAVLPPYHVALACALRVALEPLAQHLLKAYQVSREDYDAHVKPRQCPVCGAHAAAAYVGPTPLSEGNGRILYCAHCSATWEYERIRCGHCGSTNQGKLHYFHLEGDTAHRLHLCNECGNYLKTSFVAQSPVPFSFEVEEVVMVSLEQVAQDERFQAEGN